MLARLLRRVTRRRVPWWVLLLVPLVGLPTLLVILLVVVLLVVVASVTAAAPTGGPGAAGAAGEGGTVWDAGNIISDAVFYNATTMTAAQIQAFLDAQGCTLPGCLGRGTYTWPATSVGWCQPVAAGSGSFAQLLAVVSVACGINPQVTLVMIQKESQGLTRNPPPAALTGAGCPDTGPGGSANCDASASGVWAQTFGFVSAMAHLRADPTRLNYPPGQTTDILWNVAETGCGAAPVTVQNTATASLYTWTPYQPNAASLAAYPGVGDGCSSYGNRNFFYQFQKFFGPTGGGRAATPAGRAGIVNVAVNGVAVTLPPEAGVTGTVLAPNATAAEAIAAGLSQLGVQYAWGGGDANGPTLGIHDGGIADSYGDYHRIGFDCAGLMLYSWARAGVDAPRGSQEQARSGIQVPWDQRLPGDMIGAPGHITMYLGVFGGTDYWLESPQSGGHVQVSPVRSGHYSTVARVWSTSP